MNRILCLLSLIFFTATAQASEARFIDVEQIHAEQLLAPPPVVGSPASQNELATLHQIQTSRSKLQVKTAQSDEAAKSIFLYQDVLGEKFNAENFTITARFSKRIKKDVHLATTSAKNMFHRVRPYHLDKTLTPVCHIKMADNSYPSEHSTLGYVYALVLIEIMPEKRDVILARADEYAYNRLVCGAHFPSDVAAGKKIAYAIYDNMDRNPQFQKALTAVRNELRTSYGLPIMPHK